LYILLISKFLEIIMKNVVVADFKVKSDKVQEMAEVFKEALVVTRDFDGCLGIDVYYEDKTKTYTLIEDWDSLEQYEIYLQWRIDTGIAELLDPILENGWDSVVDSVKRLGTKESI